MAIGRIDSCSGRADCRTARPRAGVATASMATLSKNHSAPARNVVVMGAGPGGLCAAYALTRAGMPAHVVEKAPFVGGLARTIRRQTEHGEFRFDIGGHRWFTKNDELNALFRE